MNIPRSITPARLADLLARNTWRKPLDPITEARGFQQLRDAGWSTARIGRRTGHAACSIRRALQLLAMPPEFQRLVARGRLHPRCIRSTWRYREQPKVCMGLVRLALSTGIAAEKIKLPARLRAA